MLRFGIKQTGIDTFSQIRKYGVTWFEYSFNDIC